MIAPRNALEFEQTFSLWERGEVLARVLSAKLFRFACFSDEDEVKEQAAATRAAGLGRNVNPYPKGDARRKAWNSGFRKTLV